MGWEPWGCQWHPLGFQCDPIYSEGSNGQQYSANAAQRSPICYLRCRGAYFVRAPQGPPHGARHLGPHWVATRPFHLSGRHPQVAHITWGLINWVATRPYRRSGRHPYVNCSKTSPLYFHGTSEIFHEMSGVRGVGSGKRRGSG